MLSSFAYDPSTHPITLVLRGATKKAAVAATLPNANSLEAFLPQKTPTFVDALLTGEQIRSAGPQPSAVVRFTDRLGPVDLTLENVTFRALTESSCSLGQITVDAFLPKTQGAVVLHPATGPDVTIKSIIDSDIRDAGAGDAWQVRMLFQAETVSFDYGGLP